MSTYSPDSCVILKMIHKLETTYKILCCWSGGYLTGDSWKLSSGITSYEEFDKTIEFMNYSGSIYVCHKSCERMSSYIQSVYNSFMEQVKDVPETDITVLTYEQYLLQRN